MPLSMNLDLRDLTKEGAESGSRLPPGWYRAEVYDLTEDPKMEGVLDFTFRVTAGPFTGQHISDKLFSPDMAADEKKAKATRSRIALFATRLGVIPDTSWGKEVAVNWPDAVGRECWIKVIERTYTGKDGQPAKTSSLAFDGVYALDDGRVPAEARNGKAAATAPKATGTQSTQQPAPQRTDYGDL